MVVERRRGYAGRLTTARVEISASAERTKEFGGGFEDAGFDVFSSPIDGDRKLPTVASRDIAAAAARLLLDDSWSHVEEVPLLGSEDLSFNDMAEIISEIVGKQICFQQSTFEAYRDRFVSFGMSDAMAHGMTDMAWAKNEGLDNAVRTAENSTPTSFREWCEQVLKPAVLNETETAAP